MPTRSILHHKATTLRQVMRLPCATAGSATFPTSSPPTKRQARSPTVRSSRRKSTNSFTPTHQRAKSAAGLNWQYAAKQFHDYVLFMANTGLRPNEFSRLEYRNVTIEKDEEGDERILLRGALKTRWVLQNATGAVHPFKRAGEVEQPQAKRSCITAELQEAVQLRHDRLWVQARP